MEEIICVGSIEELRKLSGCGEIHDLHRENIDHITIPSQKGKGVLRRIPDVFDCWFESGSMPFAQSHYPFSVKDDKFKEMFPGDFIAEGLDQTRGWFYTLMVISTMVKGTYPFKNLIVNGIVLAADGSKMSKSKQNYPDPLYITKSYGADACRLYLCNSPVVRAESIQFTEDGVRGVVREVFLPWFNSYRYMIQNITRYESTNGVNFVFDPNMKFQMKDGNIMDRWIISANQNLIKLVRIEMDNYKLYNVVKPLLDFFEKLSNWYVRLNRSRMKGEEGPEEQKRALNVLFDVLLTTNTLMSCITPFITEHMYQNMRNGIDPADQDRHAESIHFLQIPQYETELIDEAVENRIGRMQSAIELGRLIRDRNVLPIKTPLSEVMFVDSEADVLKDLKEMQTYITDELNVLDFKLEQKEEDFIDYKCTPDNKQIGSVLKKAYDKKLKEQISKLSSAQLKEYLKTGSIMVGAVKIEKGWLKVEKNFKEEHQKNKDFACGSNEQTCIMLRTVIDDNLRLMGQSREITNRIQKLRKSSGVSIDDQIEIFHSKPQGEVLTTALDKFSDKIRGLVKMPFLQEG